MQISIIGANGFIGKAVVRAATRYGIGHETIGRNDLISGSSSIIIDCNGNSSKFQANSNFDQSYIEIVTSVQSRVEQNGLSQKYVYISSGEVYGKEQRGSSERDEIDIDSLSNYGRLKYLAECYINSNVNDHLIIRPSGFVGKNLKKNPVYDLLYGEKIFVNPNSRFQFCDVDWFADCIIHLCIDNEVGVLNVSAHETISIQEIVDEFNLKPPMIAHESKIEFHELNTAKMAQKFVVPDTKDHVYRFIRDSIETR